MTSEPVIPCDVSGSMETTALSPSTSSKSLMDRKLVGITSFEYINSAFSKARSSLRWKPVGRRGILEGNWVRAFLIVLVMMTKAVTALPSFLTPVPGSTPKGEFQCYGLPIGGLGFASDVLTAYTTWCLLYLRRPWWPFSEKTQGPLGFMGAMDLSYGSITLVGTFCLTVFTMVRCQNHWQYLLLAIERLGMSMVFSLASLSATLASRPDGDARGHRAFCFGMWIFIMCFTNIIGGVGYLSLLVLNWENPAVRVAFGATFGGAIGFGILIVCFAPCFYIHWDSEDLAIVFMGAQFFGIVMTDWILGAIAEDISGIPADNIKVLYWLYWGFKRLPMLWS